ncbi:MAG: SpoIID/LytB domain-containing protein [Oscillospiraceae bacterium]
MKIRSVLSGITALLLVGTFYSFAFCMVEDVDDSPISMDYYYSTETEPASGEKIGEATSVNVNEADKASAEIAPAAAEEMPIIIYPEEDIADTPSAAVVTAVPSSDEDSEETAVAVAAVNETAIEESLSDDDSGATVDGVDENEAEASGRSVYAENDDDDGDRMLSKDGGVATTVPETEFEAEEIFPDDETEEDFALEDDDDFDTPETTTLPDITTIPSVPASDVFIHIDDPVYPVTETTVTTVVIPGEDISTGETLVARYNGSVHTDDAYELVCKIVNNEISGYFSDEAIKAQAVAAYSYVKYHNVNGLTPSVLVKENPSQRIREMVSSVWGKCCYYNGKVAQTVYMASSSGYTASSKNVWGGDIPYLTSVACPFDAESDPNYGVRTKFSESDIRAALEKNLGITLSDDPSQWLKVTAYIDGNYVSQINVDNQKTITGRKLRENILNYQLKSASFDVTYENGCFVFTTYGWGHGVGMSQNGANILAKMGYTYDQILKYYYTGIDVL